MLKDLLSNPLLLTDSYNLSHQFLKVNKDYEISHFYNRANPMVMYGFREIVGQVLSIKITHKMVDEAVALARKSLLPFPVGLFRRMVDDFGGVWPLRIDCLPDGQWVPRGTPFAQIRNTAKGFGEMLAA